MAVTWYVKGAMSARLINVRRLNSSKAAPKRHAQPDFQAANSECFKVLTAGDIHSYIPSLYLLQAKHQSSSGVYNDNDNGSNSDVSSEEEVDNSKSASGSSSAISQPAASSSDIAASSEAVQQPYMLSHTKPSKANNTQVLLMLRQLSGYDQRHSLQKDMVQNGIPLELVSKLASRSVDETKKYAANTCYELSDTSAMPIKLASPEWTSKDLVPLPLSADSSIEGVPVHLDLFRSPALHMGPASGVRSIADPKLAAILSSDGVKGSVKVVQGFIDNYNKNPKLNMLLHEPVLGGRSTDEQLPVKPLRDISGTIHLRSGQAVGVFLSRLLPYTAAGIASPNAERLVHPKLADVYKQLAKVAAVMSAKLVAGSQAASSSAAAGVHSETSVVPQLMTQHYAQVIFGRLDIAWQRVLQEAQQLPEEQ